MATHHDPIHGALVITEDFLEHESELSGKHERGRKAQRK